jgi:hypothetical protein
MATVTIPAASVLKGSSGQSLQGIAGETIDQGETVYRNATDQKFYLADGDDTDKKTVAGVALVGVAEGQPITVDFEDPDLVIGAHGLPVGTVIIQSATAGKMCPVADLAAGNFTTVLGVIKTSTTMSLRIVTAGVALPA